MNAHSAASIEALHRENYKCELAARHRFLKKMPTYSFAELQRIQKKTDRRGRQDLQQRIRKGRIVSVVHHGRLYIPRFQFAADGQLHPAVRKVLRVLNSAYSRWSIAHWFIAPNGWLDGDRPVDELDGDLALLMDAAEQAVLQNFG